MTQSDFHLNPFSGFRHTASRSSPYLRIISLHPELSPFTSIIPVSYRFVIHLIIHLFHTSLIPLISLDQYLTPNFTIYTKYAKYAFLLLLSKYVTLINLKEMECILLLLLKSCLFLCLCVLESLILDKSK